MRSRREGFLLSVLGMIFLIVDITLDEYIFKTHLMIDVMPDAIGYLFVTAGCVLLGKNAKAFRVASLFGIAGGLLSVFTIWQFAHVNVAALIQVLTGAAYSGFFWFYLSGIRKAAERAENAKLTGQAASLRWLILLLCLGSVVCNYIFLMQNPAEQGVAISIGVIAFGSRINRNGNFCGNNFFNRFFQARQSAGGDGQRAHV